MTFEEWESAGKKLGSMEREFARSAWEAATIAEREACLSAVQAADDCGCGVPCDCYSVGSAIYAIKARSNA